MGGVVGAHQCDFMENALTQNNPNSGRITAFGQMQAIRLSSIWGWFFSLICAGDQSRRWSVLALKINKSSPSGMYHLYTVVIDSFSLCYKFRPGRVVGSLGKIFWVLTWTPWTAQVVAPTCNKGAHRFAFTPANCYAGMG